MLAILESDFEHFINWFVLKFDDYLVYYLIIKYTDCKERKYYVNKKFIETRGHTLRAINEIYKRPFEIVNSLINQYNIKHIANFIQAVDLNEEQMGRAILLYSDKLIIESQEPLGMLNKIIETAQQILKCKNESDKTILEIKLEAYWLYFDITMWAEVKLISEMPKGKILDDYVELTEESLYSILLEVYRKNKNES